MRILLISQCHQLRATISTTSPYEFQLLPDLVTHDNQNRSHTPQDRTSTVSVREWAIEELDTEGRARQLTGQRYCEVLYSRPVPNRTGVMP